MRWGGCRMEWNERQEGGETRAVTLTTRKAGGRGRIENKNTTTKKSHLFIPDVSEELAVFLLLHFDGDRSRLASNFLNSKRGRPFLRKCPCDAPRILKAKWTVTIARPPWLRIILCNILFLFLFFFLKIIIYFKISNFHFCAYNFQSIKRANLSL